MTCEQARAAIADNILANSQGTLHGSTALQAHVESCAACRAYQHDCQSIWSALGDVSVPAPAPNARARFDDALREFAASQGNAATNSASNSPSTTHAFAQGRGSSISPRRLTPWTRSLLMAASVILAALAGHSVASFRPTQAATRLPIYAATDSQRHYLLLLYDDTTSSQRPSRSELAGIVAEYSAWARTLREKGQLVVAEELSGNERSWLGGAAVQSDRFSVGGFFLIRAHDRAEAERIAAACPHLKRGRIELRSIEPT
jgi:hypothetical protein